MLFIKEGREDGRRRSGVSQGPRQKSRRYRMHGEQIPTKRARGEEGVRTNWKESSKASIIRVSFASLARPNCRRLYLSADRHGSLGAACPLALRYGYGYSTALPYLSLLPSLTSLYYALADLAVTMLCICYAHQPLSVSVHSPTHSLFAFFFLTTTLFLKYRWSTYMATHSWCSQNSTGRKAYHQAGQAAV